MCKECGARDYHITTGMCTACILDTAMIEAVARLNEPQWWEAGLWNHMVAETKITLTKTQR